jgi:hypothetical protein
MRTRRDAGTGTRRRAGAARSLLLGTAVVLAAGCGTTAVGAGDVQELPPDEAPAPGDAHDARLDQLLEEQEAEGQASENTSGSRDSWETTLREPATEAHDSWEGQLPE